jgi:hypothetical protein
VIFLWGHLKQLVYSRPINSVESLTRQVVAVVPKFGEIVKFFSKVRDQWRGQHKRVSRIKDNIFSTCTLKVKVLCTRTFFRHNSVLVSNFLRGNRFPLAFLPFRFHLLFIRVDHGPK